MPYCELHYHQQTGSMCASCNQPITGGSVTALGKKWHPEHFICVFCMNPLSGVSYTEQNGKPYCKTCYKKLFYT
jgi:paxillin